MKRVILAVAVSALVIGGCGSDGVVTSPSQATAGSTPSTEATNPPTTPADTAAPTTVAPTTVAPTTAPPTTARSTETTNANEARAAAALLAPADLPGWTQAPDDGDDNDLQFSGPECAGLQQIDSLPGMDDNADITLVAPDGKLQIQEGVTVSDHPTVQTAFDLFADPSTAGCLTALFTTVLSKPGATPEGVTVTGIQFTQEPLAAGVQGISYVAALTFTGTESGVSAPLGLRFDAVRAGPGIALIVTTTGPGAAPVDPATIAVAAANKLAATP